MTSLKEVFDLMIAHHDYVRSHINLIGSENISSPSVKLAMASDLVQRYTSHRYYTQYDELESKIEKDFSGMLDAGFANVKPISGTVANLVAFLCLAARNDTIMALSLSCGGHKSYMDFGLAGTLSLKHRVLPFDEKEWVVDIDALRNRIGEVHPKLVVIGGMTILFPQPIKEIVELAHEREARVLYDAAHVFGLIVGRNFQNPIEEGVEIMTASTHKTFPGPQGGIVLGKKEHSVKIKELMRSIMANEHPFRIPSLAVALLEMSKFGEEYTAKIVENARAIGQALHERGFTVACEHKGFTRTHQVVVDVSGLGQSHEIADLLEKCGILCKEVMMPRDGLSHSKTPTYPPKSVSGLRLGMAEVTRLGMDTSEMHEIAGLMERALFKKHDPEKIKGKVRELKKEFSKLQYSFDRDADPYFFVGLHDRQYEEYKSFQ